MCGIAGQLKISKENTALFAENELDKMLAIIAHRGPDGQGKYIDDDVMFGMRRLSIIDLKNGWQPLYSEDKSIVCCCNGEIYNYIELRKNLEYQGHCFQTNSDCEVLVHMYEEFGVDFIKELNGMFAFALWDSKKKRLLLARDRLGKKPLYYSIQNGKLYFASEIKSILACSNIKRKVDLQAIDFLLTYNYIPSTMTAFKDILKLGPAEYAIYGGNGEQEKNSYWDIPVGTQVSDKSEKDILNSIKTILTESIKIRLRSDVPVGAFLSGGIDSSMVTGYASKFVDNLRTFSIGFKEEQYNELPYANKVAQLFHTNHTVEIVDANFLGLLSKTIWLNDNPHGDVSFLPTFVLSEVTAKHVKTVLTGDGGDELFGGYDKYLSFVENKDLQYKDFYENTSVFSKKEKELLYSSYFKKSVGDRDCLETIDYLLGEKGLSCERQKNSDDLNTLLYLETKLLLDGNNLEKPDRMGMGNSIEARMPLLDWRLVEYISNLPSIYKIKDGETKYIFKKLACELLPKDIVYRKKQMFTVPIGEWLKGDLKEIAYEILLDEKTTERNLFNTEFVKYMLDMHSCGRKNYTRQLRLLIILELWHRIYIDDFYAYAPELDELITGCNAMEK